MAEVKRVPQWIMLEALRNEVKDMYLEKSDGTYDGESYAVASPTDFDISTQDGDPVLRLSSTKTLQVGVGNTIMAIVLNIVDTDTPSAYDNSEDEIRYPIGGVDGESFPDGGSIEVTDFEVYLNDL